MKVVYLFGVLNIRVVKFFLNKKSNRWPGFGGPALNPCLEGRATNLNKLKWGPTPVKLNQIAYNSFA